MVDPKRSSRGAKVPLNPQTAAALVVLPPLGYKAPPTLIGFKTIDSSVIALRIKNYNRAYKNLSVNSWNKYVSFGIQDFVSPDEYYMHKARESPDEENLRLARYYRNHLENHAKVDSFLMQTIPAVETALEKSHHGFFDMSLKDMDLYLLRVNKPAEEDTPMDIDLPLDITDIPATSSLAVAAQKCNDKNSPVSSPSVPVTTQESHATSPALPITQEQSSFVAVLSTKLLKKQGSSTTLAIEPNSVVAQTQLTATQPPQLNAKRPSAIKNVVRVETRWAPKDFNELRLSTSKMNLRLVPILSCFNNEHTWMMEWQTDQMEETSDIDPAKLSKYLSIRIVPVIKDQCFYFSFRIHGTGSQFLQASALKVLSIAKRGEHFDPSSIPPSQGELTYVGDILLKDASVTHRGQYLQYLRQEVLPPDTPLFDVKLRHSNPTGSRITILTV
jgi:hypothetical protein